MESDHTGPPLMSYIGSFGQANQFASPFWPIYVCVVYFCSKKCLKWALSLPAKKGGEGTTTLIAAPHLIYNVSIFQQTFGALALLFLFQKCQSSFGAITGGIQKGGKAWKDDHQRISLIWRRQRPISWVPDVVVFESGRTHTH